MSTEQFLSVEELGNAKITKEDLSIIRLVKNRFPKPKPKAKAIISGSSKSENYKAIAKYINGIDSVKVKVDDLPEGDEKKNELRKRKSTLKNAMLELSKKDDFDYNSILKVFKASGGLMLDTQVSTVSSSNSKKPSESTESTS